VYRKVVVRQFEKDTVKDKFAKNDELVETFRLNRLNPALDVSLHVRSANAGVCGEYDLE
jgi:hypothetical protein